jgi:hypothetical protein
VKHPVWQAACDIPRSDPGRRVGECGGSSDLPSPYSREFGSLWVSDDYSSLCLSLQGLRLLNLTRCLSDPRCLTGKICGFQRRSRHSSDAVSPLALTEGVSLALIRQQTVTPRYPLHSKRRPPSDEMTRPKVAPEQRQRTAQACESCKRRKQKVPSHSSPHSTLPCTQLFQLSLGVN